MRIGLIDADEHNHVLNMCLMKLSAYHKAKGDYVELLSPGDILDGQRLFDRFDQLFGGFCELIDDELAKDLEGAGAVIVDEKSLPPEIEHIKPDWSLYGINEEYILT